MEVLEPENRRSLNVGDEFEKHFALLLAELFDHRPEPLPRLYMSSSPNPSSFECFLISSTSISSSVP